MRNLVSHWNVPALTTPPVGRDEEVNVLSNLLREGQTRPLTLTGTGGIGKTSLALQVAATLRPFFKDGICFVALAAIHDAEQVIPAMAHTLEPRQLAACDQLCENARIFMPPSDHIHYDAALEVCRAALSTQAFAILRTEGRKLPALEVLNASDTLPTLPDARRKAAYPASLTAREVDVLRLVAQGLADGQVAEQLVISPRTVTTHLTSIYNKQGVNSRAAATTFAVKHHLVSGAQHEQNTHHKYTTSAA